ncbi:unnamed protein product [Schistosoma mattheei]|uniref:Uncharacterized protein n=1 Tax=Schistosoma mattheei TaxID=31246 RepID=A0A3P8KFI5_9TREM|nr:unnamed protein product [Schistosoma mattheei]
MDVVAVHADDDGTFIRYVLTMLGYGFHSDLLRNDDKRRWMGSQRYNYSGFKTLLQHASYHGEISFLPCSDPNNLSSNGIVCNSGYGKNNQCIFINKFLFKQVIITSL